jgi:aspartate kinase
MNEIIVQKYGGATLATPEKILAVAKNIAQLKKQNIPLVIVVSAMGETTNQLISLAHKVSKQPTLREMDMLLTTGERISTALLSMALNDLNVEAVSFTGSQAGIITDDSHFNAVIKDIRPHRVLEALKENKVVVLAGFQGVSEKTKEITTLGRGGSDTTAIAMAHFLKAKRCEILKDVSSIFTADPKIVSDAKSLAKISYDQLYNMTFWGAKVLNYRSAEIARQYNVPLYIGPAFGDQKANGTLVSDLESDIQNLHGEKLISINSHKQVLKLNNPEFSNFLNLIKPQQIPEPQILIEDSNHFWITYPEEIMTALFQSIKLEDTKLASATCTFSAEPSKDLIRKLSTPLAENNIKIVETIIAKQNLSFIVGKNDKVKVIEILHRFV